MDSTTPLVELRLPKPALRGLIAAGFSHLGDVAAVDARSLLRLHGVGPLAIDRLRIALGAAGLTFARE